MNVKESVRKTKEIRKENMMNNGKINRKILPWAALIMLILLLIASNYNAFFLLPEQKMVVRNLERELRIHNGNAKIQDIYPVGNWDTACVIPAYAYTTNPKHQDELKKYFGKNYHFSWFRTPDPMSMFYGIGLSFLKDEELINFVQIPSMRILFFKGGQLITRDGFSIAVPSYAMKGAQDRLYFSDLNVSTKVDGQYCYPRSSAYIEFQGYQHIFVGG